LKQKPEIIASVDLGSNSFHMIVCRIQNDQLIVLDRIREMVRLAAGIDKKKILSEEVQQRALDCLSRFGQRLRDLPPSCVRIVGTNTLRSARNSPEFIKKAEQCLGHAIEVISGVEEARLIYLGVAHSLASDDNQRRLVMDIGGGSTELIVGEHFEPMYMESLYMGCVSMSRRFFKSGKITREKIKKAETAVELELEPYVLRLKKYNWEDALGASGTIRAINKIVLAHGWSDNGITFKSLKKLREHILNAGHIDKLDLKDLDPERLPVFTGGAMILYTTFKMLGIEFMRVSDGALREGLIHDLLGRIQHADIRSHSVSALATRYHVDMEQVERVQETAKYCFMQLADHWQLDVDNHLQWLEWAAMLCEIGLDIAHSHYQLHGAYILENSDIAGFSRQEQSLLATLVLAHRRKLPLDAIDRLPDYWRQLANKLIIILRLAMILNRSRTRISHLFRLSTNDNQVILEFEKGWLDEHSLTKADLEEEAGYLESVQVDLSFH
jgi:exopolyphosphatase/guanosine-5'-triphosphate,3'-diphosphate pyrophosphatase